MDRLAPILLACALACQSGGATLLTPDPLPGPGDYERTLDSGGLEREYRLHAPPAIDAGQPLPVLLVFHGTPSNPAQMQAYTGLDAVADRHGFLVVYPAAIFGDWATGCLRCGSAADLARVDDVAFVRALVDRIATDTPVDRSRVVAAGYSNGALLVQRLACDAADLLAGFASVAATAIEPAVIPPCAPARSRPILFFHGTLDRVFPPAGRTFTRGDVSVSTLSLDATVDAAAARNGCSGVATPTELPDLAEDGTTVEQIEGEGCAAAVALYRIEGGGHTWPGSPLEDSPLLGPTTRDLDASEEIARRLLPAVAAPANGGTSGR